MLPVCCVHRHFFCEWDCNRAGRQLCCQCAPAPPHPSSPGHCASGLRGEPQCSSHHLWPSVHLGPGQIWGPWFGYLRQQQLASACCCFTRACLPGHNPQPCLSATACLQLLDNVMLISAVHIPSLGWLPCRLLLASAHHEALLQCGVMLAIHAQNSDSNEHMS